MSQKLPVISGKDFLKPVIKGTRITVQNIVEELAAGYSVDSIIEARPPAKKGGYLRSSAICNRGNKK
jgi:hypothetical protein